MISQIQIIPEPNAPAKEKGDFFELLLRSIMEAQRYKITERINFTGTEIDLLCQHMDRANDTAVVECKARTNVVADDIKSFSFDVLVSGRAKYGFFVHTSELHHQAAGMVEELKSKSELTFWGPEKVIELLQHIGAITSPPVVPETPALTPTKRILLYTYMGRFWMTLLSNKMYPTHYQLSSASSSGDPISDEALRWISEIDEIRNLTRVEGPTVQNIPKTPVAFDSVAEIQEAEEWDDYRPVGSRFFVGREDATSKLYQFVQAPLQSASDRRVFFIESKSGWGKSSVVAHLRARCRNRRNKNWLFVLAVDSRSANTGAFVSLSVAKLVSAAVKSGFLPTSFSETNVASSYDALASPQMRSVLSWLRSNKRVLVLVFDQFEDMFRKADLFRTFHKFMMDVHDEQGNIIVGFSWKSEINIPIDNPAYSLWQQTRDLAEPFRLDEFLGFEVDRVLKQLEVLSGQQLPADLKRRLKESSQGFPWLTKRLAIHCYHQMRKGVSPEELVDQNLNVDVLMREDMETLSAEEARALKHIARRGYEGDPLDVSEIDDKRSEAEINSLLNKRMIVRSGFKYNVYWDIFRDFLVEGKVPPIGESFLLRQFPTPCVNMLEVLLHHNPATMEQIMHLAPRRKEGTALNRLRELRYLGAVTKNGDYYRVRPGLKSLDDFKNFIHDRLTEHIVARSLRQLPGDTISHPDVVDALKANFKGYGFGNNTWETYASYFIAWLRYAGLDFGRRLNMSPRPSGLAAVVPQWRPEKDCDLLFSFRGQSDKIPRSKALEKGFYDLKSLGLLQYEGKTVALTKRGLTVLKLGDLHARQEIARLALSIPKVQQAYERLKMSHGEFLDLSSITSGMSDSYRKVATGVLKAWARFIFQELDGGIWTDMPPLFQLSREN